MANTLPPVPYKVIVVDESGYVNETWAKWFRAMFERLGGFVAPTIAEIAAQLDVDGIQGEITTLQAQVASLQNDVAGLGTDPVP